MNIFTYYEPTSFLLQLELIELWKQSWRRYGFNPIVLSRDDAKNSSLYNQYYDFIQDVHSLSVGQSLPESDYCLAAQLEIVAFHTIEEPAYISDYDMINNGFTNNNELIENIVHWRCDACSCFASGNKTGWEKYIKFLFDQQSKIIDWCRLEHNNSGRIYFHDQDFLVAVRDIGIKNHIYKMYRNLSIAGSEYYVDKPNTCKVIHLSHNCAIKIKNECDEYKNFSVDTIRIKLAEKIIHDNN